MISTKIKAAFVAFVMTAVILGGQVSASVVSKDSTDKSKASGLTLDKEVTVTLQSKDEVGLYSFTPSKSGTYRVIFERVGDYQFNVGAYLFGNDLSNPIDTYMFMSVNKQVLYCCYSFALTQGKTYYIKARTNSSSKNEYKMKLVYGSDSTTSKIGWVNLNNKWYFCNITGQFTEGGYWIDGELYWFNNDYTMLTGWLTLDNGQNWRYFDLGKGNMVKGWKQINGKWFFFDNNGLMVSGWKEINKTWYGYLPACD